MAGFEVLRATEKPHGYKALSHHKLVSDAVNAARSEWLSNQTGRVIACRLPPDGMQCAVEKPIWDSDRATDVRELLDSSDVPL